MKKLLCTAMLILLAGAPAVANDKAKLMDELSGYLEFVDYGGGTIFAEQIPKSEYSKMMIIDARDASQFAKEHIPGAVNIEWRKVFAERAQLPKNKTILVYCNTSSFAAQVAMALRLDGFENVRMLYGGFNQWKAAGGMDAYARATKKQ